MYLTIGNKYLQDTMGTQIYIIQDLSLFVINVGCFNDVWRRSAYSEKHVYYD